MIRADWVSFALTAMMIVLHYLAPTFRRLSFIPEQKLASFSGGFAVAYVFLHLLPALTESKETIGAVLSQNYNMTPVKDLIVYICGLIGLLFFLGLSRFAKHQEREKRLFLFYVHLAAFAIFNAIVTYTMPVRVEAGVLFAILFTAAISAHFIFTDRWFEKHFPGFFNVQGRFLLMGALFFGWLLAVLMEPDDVFVVALLSAFVGGGLLMNVLHNELPEGSRSSYPWFTLGAILGTVLLLIATAAKQTHSV